MWKIIGLQWLVGGIVCLAMFGLSTQHAISAAWGLTAVALPSTVFAVRLAIGSRSAMAGTMVFLTGEFLKVAATVLIMFVASRIDPDLIWWSLVVTAIAALKSYFLAFFLR